MAAVGWRTLKEHGLRIPEDLAVVGFNNDAIAKLVEPALTTIDYPGADMGEIAARNLINHLQGTGDLDQKNHYCPVGTGNTGVLYAPAKYLIIR